MCEPVLILVCAFYFKCKVDKGKNSDAVLVQSGGFDHIYGCIIIQYYIKNSHPVTNG